MDKETLIVTQADRDAAADALEHLNVHGWEKSVRHIRAGNADRGYSVQAFARHRIATRPTPDDGLVEIKVGDCVEKTGGDYRYRGTVVAAFRKLAGQPRLVVENADGMLFIFNEKQLTKAALASIPRMMRGER